MSSRSRSRKRCGTSCPVPSGWPSEKTVPMYSPWPCAWPGPSGARTRCSAAGTTESTTGTWRESPGCPGIPAVLRDLILPVPYNDLHALEARLDTEGGETACLVMEPVAEVLPDPGYLDGVRSLTRKHGVVLIFDEIMTGLRLAPGGRPGTIRGDAGPGLPWPSAWPMGCPCPRWPAPMSLPKPSRPLSTVSPFAEKCFPWPPRSAVLDLVRDRDVSGHLWTTGDLLREGFEECARRHGVPHATHGPFPAVDVSRPRPSCIIEPGIDDPVHAGVHRRRRAAQRESPAFPRT